MASLLALAFVFFEAVSADRIAAGQIARFAVEDHARAPQPVCCCYATPGFCTDKDPHNKQGSDLRLTVTFPVKDVCCKVRESGVCTGKKYTDTLESYYQKWHRSVYPKLGEPGSYDLSTCEKIPRDAAKDAYTPLMTPGPPATTKDLTKIFLAGGKSTVAVSGEPYKCCCHEVDGSIKCMLAKESKLSGMFIGGGCGTIGSGWHSFNNMGEQYDGMPGNNECIVDIDDELLFPFEWHFGKQ